MSAVEDYKEILKGYSSTHFLCKINSPVLQQSHFNAGEVTVRQVGSYVKMIWPGTNTRWMNGKTWIILVMFFVVFEFSPEKLPKIESGI